jgi:adenylate cyclase
VPSWNWRVGRTEPRRTHGEQRLRAALFVAVGLGMTGIVLVAFGAALLKSFELSTIDARFSVRGDQPTPKDVVVVGIDDVTFSELRVKVGNRLQQVQWPYPRRFHARMIDILKRNGARVIAYDVQFTEPTDPVDDNALITAIDRARNVVLSTTEVDAKGRANVLGGEAVLRHYHGRVGNGLLPPDTGGVVRRVSFQIAGLQSFSIVAAEGMMAHAMRPSALHGKTAWIDFRGPPGTIAYASFSRVLAGKVPASFFRGKVVVVGAFSPSLHDAYATSTSGNGLMPGPEIQANAIWTALHGFPLRSAGSWLTLLLVLAFGLMPPIAGLRLGLGSSLIVPLLLGGIYVVVTQLAFNAGWVIPFVYPISALALSTVGAVGAHYSVAAFERQRVRDVFSRFVPEQVVDQVLAQTGKDLRLVGATMVGTVVFTDLRGFTSFSEERPPDEVIDVVNKYLEEMTDAVLSNGGTLIGYEGDGIMAVFGAPIESVDHADLAVAASREMIQVRLPRFNDWLRERGLGDGFRMGIGLHSGQFVAGNVGSERRLEYTVMGDTTNTASRIQGMTKGTRHMLMFSEETRALLQEQPHDLVHVDSFEVRGRQARISLWSLEDISDPPVAAPAPVAAATPAR